MHFIVSKHYTVPHSAPSISSHSHTHHLTIFLKHCLFKIGSLDSSEWCALLYLHIMVMPVGSLVKDDINHRGGLVSSIGDTKR